MKKKYILLSISLLIELTINAQDFKEFSKGVESVLLKDYGKTIRGKGAVVDGIKQGEWVYYTGKEDGNVFAKGSYIDGKKNGEWVTFYSNNLKRLKTKELYRKDTLLSLIYFNDTKQKKIEIVSKKGLYGSVLPSLYKLCYNNPAQISIYMNKGLTWEDATYETVTLFARVLFQNKANCELRYYNYDLLLSDKRVFVNGDETTIITDYYMKKVNKFSEYNGGKKTKEVQYLQTNPNNFEVTFYYPNETIREKQEFRNKTQKHGKWIKYYENGDKASLQSYNFGVEHGWFKEWDKEGNLILNDKYKKGKKLTD